ncbi:MAG: hypothetical protein ACREQ5_39545 [Candidatus Dormibacteria bacterium]
METREIARWDLDELPPELLEVAYREMAEFVAWLRRIGYEQRIPDCWYFHRHLVYRLAAVMHWHREIYGTPRSSREAAEWWSSLWGLPGILDAWKEALQHRGSHFSASGQGQEPTPSMERVVELHAQEYTARRVR